MCLHAPMLPISPLRPPLYPSPFRLISNHDSHIVSHPALPSSLVRYSVLVLRSRIGRIGAAAGLSQPCQTLTSAPPVHSLRRILEGDVGHTCFPLWRQPSPHPSAFGHSCSSWSALFPSAHHLTALHRCGPTASSCNSPLGPNRPTEPIHRFLGPRSFAWTPIRDSPAAQSERYLDLLFVAFWLSNLDVLHVSTCLPVSPFPLHGQCLLSPLLFCASSIQSSASSACVYGLPSSYSCSSSLFLVPPQTSLPRHLPLYRSSQYTDSAAEASLL